MQDDDSLPANSQRNLPEMSQDTLALFSNVVREEQRLSRGRETHSLATASVLSTLANSEALHNPFSHVIPSLPTRTDIRFPVPTRTPLFDHVQFAQSHKAEQDRLLKLLLVSSGQGRSMAIDFVFRGICGKGAFSEVHKVSHRLDGSLYAIKKSKHPMFSNKARRDSLQEVFALSTLQGHPNILSYKDAWFEEKGQFLLIQTEYIPDGNLYSRFVEKRKPMPSDHLFYLAKDISSALSYVHQRGIVHLDVKPDNIFQCHRGLTRSSYVLADFGLACHKEGFDARSTEGDARYLPPEALAENPAKPFSFGEKQKATSFSDLRAGDVFSLGATLYELAMGVPLQKSGRNPNASREAYAQMAEQVGQECGSDIVRHIVMLCLEPDPAVRISASNMWNYCETIGSLTEDAKRVEMEGKHEDMEKKLAQYKKYLGTIIKMGEAGREAFRTGGRKRTHCPFS